MDARNPSKNADKENRRKQLAKCVLVLTKWFEKWMTLPGSHQVSKAQIAVYAEALIDLPLEALEFGCAEATRTAERFPWPGHIRKAAENYQAADDRSQFLGARGLEWDPELEKQRIERKLQFERLLSDASQTGKEKAPEQVKTKPSTGATRHAKSWEQQKQELKDKGWLT